MENPVESTKYTRHLVEICERSTLLLLGYNLPVPTLQSQAIDLLLMLPCSPSLIRLVDEQGN